MTLDRYAPRCENSCSRTRRIAVLAREGAKRYRQPAKRAGISGGTLAGYGTRSGVYYGRPLLRVRGKRAEVELPVRMQTDTVAPPARRIKELEVMVADVVVETPDTSTLVFFTGNDRLDYKAGHFLTIDPHQFEALDRFTAFLEHLKGKPEPPRAYSMCSAPHERYLAVTVKEERFVPNVTKYPPLLSPLLVKRTVRGMRFVVTGFTGPYTLPPDIASQTEHIVHICAGSGSVPNLSILKFALMSHPTLHHTFIYSNKTWQDVIFRETLEELAREYPGRLRVVHTLTRETDEYRFGPNVRKGRINEALLRELIPEPADCFVYLCGPGISKWDREAARETGTAVEPKFIEMVLATLREIGVPDSRIKRESYG